MFTGLWLINSVTGLFTSFSAAKLRKKRVPAPNIFLQKSAGTMQNLTKCDFFTTFLGLPHDILLAADRMSYGILVQN